MRKPLAALFAVLFVVTTVLVLLLISVDSVLLNADTYKHALVEQKIYEQAPALAAEQVGGTPSVPAVGSGQMAYLSLLPPADWKLLVGALFPPADLQKITEDGLDQVFSYLNGDSASARVYLVALKQHLAGPAGQEAIKLVLEAKPACTLEQLTQVAANILGGSGALILCRPPAEIIDMAVSVVQASMGAAIAQVPDQVEIIKPGSTSVPAAGGGLLGNDPRTVIRTIRSGARLGPLLPLGLLLLVTIFGVRSLKGWLRWWGISLFVAGLIALGISVAAAPALDWAWTNYIAVRIPTLVSLNMSAAAHALLNAVAYELSKRIVLYAGAVLLLGLAAIGGSSFVNKQTTGPLR